MIEIRHQLPGRLRLRIPALAQQPGLATALTAALAREPGVQQVRANPACATLVVGYDPARLPTPALTAWLLDLLGQAGGHPPARVPPASGRALATGPRGPAAEHRQPLPHRATREVDTKQRTRPGAGTRYCLLCRLNARLTSWMLRTALRCWWDDWRGARGLTPASAKGPRRPADQIGAPPLLERLRKRFGLDGTGQALSPVP